MIDYVYILTHSYEYGENGEYDEVKYLGVYSIEDNAKRAVEFFYGLPGFNKYPKSCFYIGKYQIDKNAGWEEGFISSDEASSIQTSND